jgi:septation ring formation regulator EzrA
LVACRDLATDQTKEDILDLTMSAIYNAQPSTLEGIEEQITQLTAEKKALSVRIRRLKYEKRQYHNRSAELDREAQMQKKIVEVRSTLPQIPTHLPTYRRTADTQQRRCKALREVMITEG